jgi:hypothetical protein
MKTGLWILILALTSWTINDRGMNVAWAGITVSAVSTSTITQSNGQGGYLTTTQVNYSTITTTDTSHSTSTNTACGKDGASWTFCNPTDPAQQKNSEQNNKANNDQGASQSTMLGLAAIAAGVAMVAMGVALMASPPTAPAGAAMMAAGMILIAMGMAALAAASQMNKNANKSGLNGTNLDNLSNPYQSTISTTPSTSSTVDTGSSNVGNGGNTNGIKIDPALTRVGKLDTIFGDMENKTGLSRDALLNGVGSGQNPLDLLANSPAMSGKPGGSSANLQKIMDDTLAKGNLPSGQDVMDKLGLTSADLGGGDGSGAGSAGGADPNRGLASGSANANLDSMFPGAATTPSDGKNNGTAMKVSSEVQAALDKNGITGRSIFEMVHQQYTHKTPMMFGVQKEKNGTSANPYSNLGGEKIEI